MPRGALEDRRSRTAGCGAWKASLQVRCQKNSSGKLVQDTRDYVVVMRLSDLGTIKSSTLQYLAVTKVVHEHFSIDLGRVQYGTALPQQIRLFAGSFDEHVHFASDPMFLAL